MRAANAKKRNRELGVEKRLLVRGRDVGKRESRGFLLFSGGRAMEEVKNARTSVCSELLDARWKRQLAT